MDKWRLETTRDGEWHEYTLLRNGDKSAYARWRQHGTDAELHNAVYKPSKSVMAKTVELFEVLKKDMKAHGCTTVVVADVSDNVDDKRRKYWRFMGFTFMVEVHGHTCAVMEV